MVIKDDIKELTVDGVKMVFQNTPGTEAPAEIYAAGLPVDMMDKPDGLYQTAVNETHLGDSQSLESLNQ